MSPVEPLYSNGSAHVDGRLVPISEAKISLLDWGFLHSDATYDVAHVWQGSFFRLDDHIDRFYASMEKLLMVIPYNREQLKAILNDCVAATGYRDAYVEMICTRGMPEPGSRDPRNCSNQFFAFVIPFVWIYKPKGGTDGLQLIISDQQRIPPTSIDPTIKNYHWLDMVTGLFEAYRRDGDTVVLVDAQSNLVEGPGFNIFAVKNNCLFTPATGVLEGITRRTVIELAASSGYKVAQASLSKQQTREADEVFITSTAGGVMPVTYIDGQPVSDGYTGKITRELRRQYWALHDRPEYRIDVTYA